MRYNADAESDEGETMTIERQSQTVKAGALPPDFILPDPPRIPDMLQNAQTRRFEGALDAYFKRRDDVLVAGQGYLRHDPTNESEQYAPDCVVAFGVDAEAIVSRNGYVISEAGKPPDFVLEVASKSTGRRDYTVKRDGYARYRAKEYWRFDKTGGRWHDAPLAGDALVDGEYVPIEIIQDEDGRLWGYSEVLGLHLCWDDGFLRFYDSAADRFLPDPVEMSDIAEEAEARADEAESRADAESERADKAESRADEAETHADAESERADAATAENERLRARLREAGIEE